MNIRTFHKLSEQILNDHEENKENQILNMYQFGRTRSNGVEKAHMSKDQIINMKKMNAKKIQQMNMENQKNIYSLKQNYQKEKNDLVQKYQKIIMEKEQYIKMLQELCSQKEQINESNSIYSQQKYDVNKSLNRQKSKSNLYKNNQHSLYTHQTPLFGDLCFSIQRPLQLRKQKNGDFCSTKKIKSRVISNQKCKNQNSVSSSKYRSQSSTRNSSRHGLAPACPPKYCKVL